MSKLRSSVTWASAALIAVAYIGRPEPVQAGRLGGFGAGFIAGGVAGALLGGVGRGGKYRGESRRGRHHRETTREARPREHRDPEATKEVVASLGALSGPEQVEILARINQTEVVKVVGTTKALDEVGKTVSNDDGRDYTKKITSIVGYFKSLADKADDKARGDITEHAIEQSLDRAFKNAKLDTFESFLGENWSAERLRVMVIERVEVELPRLSNGNNQGNTPMEALDRLIQRAAESVYRRIFETSELLAANRGSALFVQRLYQTHGRLVDSQLREITDRLITQASNAAVAKFEPQMRRDENGFALRYRAQRIVFDCLSEHVVKITSSETAIATPQDIERRLLDTSTSTCVSWLEYQFGTGDAINPQKPMPLRVVWSEKGPKDDASMYGRAGGSF